MTTFTFNSRETYIAYRAEWKAAYATISQNQRDLKRTISTGMRDGKHMYSSQWDLIRGTTDANSKLEELQSAKVEANKQYLIGKEV